jgi:hypothetical protein
MHHLQVTCLLLQLQLRKPLKYIHVSYQTNPITHISSQKARSRWASAYCSNETHSMFPEDSLEAYLEAPPVTPDVIRQAGGVLAYWEQAQKTRPHLARMALDYLSAPGQKYIYYDMKLLTKINSRLQLLQSMRSVHFRPAALLLTICSMVYLHKHSKLKFPWGPGLIPLGCLMPTPPPTFLNHT